MNDQLVHELEKRGLRRSRGIKRIISTHKKRMGFMFTISLAFIISGMLSNCATAIYFFFSWLSIQYLKSVIFFMANPTRVFYHSLYHYVCLPQTRKSPILPKIGFPFSPHIIINLDHSWRWNRNPNASLLVGSHQTYDYYNRISTSLACTWIFLFSLFAVHYNDPCFTLRVL